MSIIETHNVHKVYNPDSDIPVHAVNDVSLEIEKGEFSSIVGPSGSGKTSLLNMIGGLDHPNEGKVIVNGVEVSHLTGNRLIDFRLENIGFVFQAFNLIPVLTAIENVAFVMELQKREKKERQQRAMELLRAVGLEDKRDKRPNELSGGQQQRVAVARALAAKPKFVLADEPTASLDSESTADLLDLMLRLNKEENMTFIFSTHDQRVIDRARRVITLVDGKIDEDRVQNVDE